MGAALVEAYEQRKRPLIEAVFEEYLAMWNAAIARGDRRSHPEEPGTPAENVGAFERETMIKVCLLCTCLMQLHPSMRPNGMFSAGALQTHIVHAWLG